MTDLSSSETLAIQKEGYQAYLDNKSPRDNPYPYSDYDRCMAWISGYSASRTDRARRMTNSEGEQ